MSLSSDIAMRSAELRDAALSSNKMPLLQVADDGTVRNWLQYIVDYDGASDDKRFAALSATPVEALEETYALEEVRRSPMLRDRTRRLVLNTIKSHAA